MAFTQLTAATSLIEEQEPVAAASWRQRAREGSLPRHFMPERLAAVRLPPKKSVWGASLA